MVKYTFNAEGLKLMKLNSLILAGLAAAMLIGCSSQPTTSGTTGTTGDTKTTGGTPAPEGKKLKVGIVFDTGGLGDKSFNDSANRGMLRAETELGIEKVIVQSKSASDYETNISSLAGDGCDLVIAVGLGMDEYMGRVAPQFPDIKFAIVDGASKSENCRSLLFKEEQGSFLAGYLAGLMSKTGKIGFVGGMEIPLIKKFQYGYWAGALHANPKIGLLGAKYTMNWDSTDKGKASAAALYAEGADIVYHAAGRAGLGVFQAAKDADKYAIGVDSDQDDIAQGKVLTSMIKKVDEAVFQTIKDTKEGKFSGGEKLYDVASNGIGLSEMRFTKDLIGEEILGKIEAVKQDIISGKITAPTTKEEFEAFQKAHS